MDPLQFAHDVSASGILFYIKNLPWITGWVELRVILRAGARYDPAEKEGMAHFLEHLLSKGSSKFRSHPAMQHVLEKLFADASGSTADSTADYWNFATSFEVTAFQGKVLKADLVEAMTVLNNIFFHPLLRAEDLRKERRVVKQEIWRGIQSKKAAQLLRLVRQDIYHDHPFGRTKDVYGWADTVESITQDDLRNFHEAHYHLANAILLFVGDITLEEAHELSQLFTEGAPSAIPNPVPTLLTSWPEPRQPGREISAKEWYSTAETLLEYAEVNVTRVIPRQANPEVLTILGDMLGKLLSDLVREDLASGYSPSLERSDFLDHHLWEIEVKVTPESVDEVREAIQQILAGFGAPDQYEDRFRESRRSLMRAIGFSDKRAYDIAEEAEADLAEQGKIIPLEERRAQRAAVAYSDVCDLVAREFAPDKLYWFIVRP